MKDSVFTPRIGSEVFETSVMKTEEVVLFVQAATQNGCSLETAYEDMQMIDTLLHMQRLHFVVHGHVKKTKAGFLRKGSSLYDAFSDVINARVIEGRAK